MRLSEAMASETPVIIMTTGARGRSFADIARLTGAYGANITYTDLQVLEAFADYAIAENPGFEGPQGNPGSNVMAIGLKTAASAMNVGAGVEAVYTSGYSVRGKGAARYILDAAVTAAYVLANPRTSFRTADGFGYRLDPTQLGNPYMTGAAGDGVADDSDAVNACSATFPVAWWNIPGTFLMSRDHLLTPGHHIYANEGMCELKVRNQITATTTAAIAAGTTARTVTVSAVGALAVGMSVMVVTPPSTVSHTDPFAHLNRVLSAAGGGSVTIAAGANLTAHASGAIIATTCQLLTIGANSTVQGLTLNGNSANQTYGYWMTSCLLAAAGDNIHIRNCRFINSVADAVLIGGPAGGEIKGSWVEDCTFENIGGNGIHYGNARDMWATGNRMKNGNMRMGQEIVKGGGGTDGGRGGHQDGAIIYSQGLRGLRVENNEIESWLCGVHVGNALSQTIPPGNLNDEVLIRGNIFRTCSYPWEVSAGSPDIVISGNECFQTFPLTRWAESQCSVRGAWEIATPARNARRVTVSNNTGVNVTMLFDRLVHGTVHDNVLDCSAMTATSNVAVMGFYNFEGVSAHDNILVGGPIGLWLQNSFAAQYPYGRESIFHDNILLDSRLAGMTGTVVGDAPLRVDFHHNIMRGTAANGSAAAWLGAYLFPGMRASDNRVSWDTSGGSAWGNANNAAFYGRRNNMVNGAYELLSEFATEAAAIAAGLPVGGQFRIGTVTHQRITP